MVNKLIIQRVECGKRVEGGKRIESGESAIIQPFSNHFTTIFKPFSKSAFPFQYTLSVHIIRPMNEFVKCFKIFLYFKHVTAFHSQWNEID